MKNHQLELKERQTALHYIKTLADTVREPFLILDPKLKVIFANNYFFKTFQVTKKDTEGKLLYNLGNYQWDIPELKKLLKDILPHKKVVKDYAVTSDFPFVGIKTMRLNAQQVDAIQLIIICFEDITIKEALEKKEKEYTKSLEMKVAERTSELCKKVEDLEELTKVMVGRELKMSELKKEIARIKKLKKLKNNNGGNGDY